MNLHTQNIWRKLTWLKYLPGSPGDSNGQFYVGGEINLEDNGKAYTGYGTYVGGWNNGSHFTP